MLYALFIVLLLSNLYTAFIGGIFIHFARRLTGIPKAVLYSAVPVFCVIGSYASKGSMFDVSMMFFFGIIGYALSKLRISMPTLIVAFFLGALLEHKIRQSLSISRGDWMIFVDRPISCAFLVMTALVILFYICRHVRPGRAAA